MSKRKKPIANKTLIFEEPGDEPQKLGPVKTKQLMDKLKGLAKDGSGKITFKQSPAKPDIQIVEKEIIPNDEVNITLEMEDGWDDPEEENEKDQSNEVETV